MMRLCAAGQEVGRVTHLLLGSQRRTLKLLLAIANGAWLLEPAWLTDSVEKVCVCMCVRVRACVRAHMHMVCCFGCCVIVSTLWGLQQQQWLLLLVFLATVQHLFYLPAPLL
jgi:hypothetical protein